MTLSLTEFTEAFIGKPLYSYQKEYLDLYERNKKEMTELETKNPTTIFYRYVDKHFTNELYLEKYKIAVETPCGYWLQQCDGCFNTTSKLAIRKDRWISKGYTKKKFACKTKEDALKQFIIRYKKRKEHLERYIRSTDRCLSIANSILEKGVTE